MCCLEEKREQVDEKNKKILRVVKNIFCKIKSVHRQNPKRQDIKKLESSRKQNIKSEKLKKNCELEKIKVL